uniref:RRM domain-containing protein n=1 Tax=Salarias fasciatus TaxID=181472 RepID=A0A672GBJ9_SALFA
MSSGRAAAEDEDMVSLIVGNLTRNATKDSLRRVFEDYGHICDIHIPWKCHYAFVRFINRQDAEEAVQGLNGLRLDGRTIRVELAQYVFVALDFSLSSSPPAAAGWMFSFHHEVLPVAASCRTVESFQAALRFFQLSSLCFGSESTCGSRLLDVQHSEKA